MFSRALRYTPRQALPRISNGATRRFIGTAPPVKKGTWKGTAVRWAAAVGVVYYYNTSTLFAEETEEEAIQRLDQSLRNVKDSNLPTLEAIEAERRARREEIASQELEKERELQGKTSLADEEQSVREDEDSMGGLEDEADQQGAFNPETGEINWDCPCLGGMAHGPCGDEFREAFSCFVYSNEEPKGVECIEKFKGMQDCFRAHPEMYASELEEDEVEEEIEEQRASNAVRSGSESVAVEEQSAPQDEKSQQPQIKPRAAAQSNNGISETPDGSRHGDEGGELIPKDLHDATASNAK